MYDLHTLQVAFKRYLFDGNSEIAENIISTEELNNVERLAIYGNAYRSRLVEALAEDYPALQYLMKEEDFVQMAQAYLQHYPSTYYSLRWFGKDLAVFLHSDARYCSHIDLAELANFEWAFIEAFDAQDIQATKISEAEIIPPDLWPSLKMHFHPSVSWVTCTWNCLAVWKAMKEEATVPAVQLLPAPANYLVWRQGLDTRFRLLAIDEIAALKAIAVGCNFAELCNTLHEWLPLEQTALRAASLLKSWLGDGLITQLDYPKNLS